MPLGTSLVGAVVLLCRVESGVSVTIGESQFFNPECGG